MLLGPWKYTAYVSLNESYQHEAGRKFPRAESLSQSSLKVILE